MAKRVVSQTINLQTPDQTGKYISKIDGGGISIHDSQRQESDYIQLTSNKIDITQNNNLVASFGKNAQLGDTKGYHINIQSGENARLAFKNNDVEIAYMSKDMLYIPRAVVVDSMQVGDETEGNAWRWVIDKASRDLTLTWIGGGA